MSTTYSLQSEGQSEFILAIRKTDDGTAKDVYKSLLDNSSRTTPPVQTSWTITRLTQALYDAVYNFIYVRKEGYTVSVSCKFAQ